MTCSSAQHLRNRSNGCVLNQLIGLVGQESVQGIQGARIPDLAEGAGCRLPHRRFAVRKLGQQSRHRLNCTHLSYRGQALAYRDMKRFDEALEAVERAIAASCNNPELYYLKAQILVAKGQDREAVPLFDQALQAAAQLPEALVEQIQMERDRAAQRSGLTGQLPTPTPSP